MDRETGKVYTEGEHIFHMTKSEGWRLAKMKLLKIMAEFSSIHSVKILGEKDEDVIREIAAKQSAIDLVLVWMKDVDQDAVSWKEQTSVLMSEDREQEHIYMYDK